MPQAEHDHLSLLYDIGELAVSMRANPDIPQLLNQVLEKVSEHLKAEVCSIYLYDEASRELVLKATIGLRVPRDQETEGLDLSAHGERGYNW